MFTHYRTQGIIVKKVDRGEADQLFTVYTKDFGKIEILGRAIRKIKSKLRSGIGLFYLSEIEFIQGKTYKTLTDAILVDNFPNVRKDLRKLVVACQISEVSDVLIRGQEPDREIWELLNEIFEKLNTRAIARGGDEDLASSTSLKLEILYYYFFWNFISILGYQPEFKNFSICEKKISVDTFKILRIILKKDLKTLLKLKFEPSHQKSLKDVSQKYFDYILNKIN